MTHWEKLGENYWNSNMCVLSILGTSLVLQLQNEMFLMEGVLSALSHIKQPTQLVLFSVCWCRNVVPNQTNSGFLLKYWTF